MSKKHWMLLRIFVLPTVVGSKLMYIETVAQENMCGTQESVWSVVTDLTRFPSFFDGFMVIPSVKQIEVLYEEPIPGGKRKVYNSDGSILEEELLVFTSPVEHQYRLYGGFTFPFSWMIHEAYGTWSFSKLSDTQTSVAWTYRFHVRSRLLAPLTYLVVKLFFTKAMSLCLKSMARTCAQEFTT